MQNSAVKDFPYIFAAHHFIAFSKKENNNYTFHPSILPRNATLISSEFWINICLYFGFAEISYYRNVIIICQIFRKSNTDSLVLRFQWFIRILLTLEVLGFELIKYLKTEVVIIILALQNWKLQSQSMFFNTKYTIYHPYKTSMPNLLLWKSENIIF